MYVLSPFLKIGMTLVSFSSSGNVGLKLQMIRWMCGVSLKDRRTSEELIKLVGVQPITSVIRRGRLRWYGHAMRKSDEDWVKKCMEYRVEGRIEYLQHEMEISG